MNYLGQLIKHYFQKKSLLLWLDRIIARSVWRQIGIALALFIALFLIVWLCFYNNEKNAAGKAFADLISPVTLRSIVYETTSKTIADTCQYQGVGCKSIPSESNNKSPLAISIIYLLGSIVFSGLLIATLTNALRTRADRFKQGKVHYSNFKEHIVILGYNDMVPGMIEKFLENQRWPNRIIVGVKKNLPEVIDEIHDRIGISKKLRQYILVLETDSNNNWELKKRMLVHHAKEVYIFGEHDDAYNLNSYEKIQSLCSANHHPECYVYLSYQSTFALFQTYIKNDGMEHFHAFNTHDIWARLLLSGKILDKEMLIDYRGKGTEMAPTADRHVHLVIVGMTEMGQALAREAAFLCHYPNFGKGTSQNNNRTTITFIDAQAKEKMTFFSGKYHHLFDLCNHSFRDIDKNVVVSHQPKNDFLDIEYEFIQANIADERMRCQIAEWAADKRQMLSIAICTDMPHRSMAAGLYLPDEVFYNRIPVWVYQPAKGDMAKYLKVSRRFNNVVTFGMSGKDLDIKNEETTKQAMKLKLLYQEIYIIHEQLNKKEISEEDFLKKVDALKPDYNDQATLIKIWRNEKIFNKWSNIYSASSIGAKRRSINDNWTEENIKEIDRVEHNRWNVEKLMMGFRATTEDEHHAIKEKLKDKSEMKRNLFAHDDICPFEDLDEVTKEYDHKFTLEINNIVPNDNHVC